MFASEFPGSRTCGKRVLHKNLLLINPQKTKLVLFGTRQPTSFPGFSPTRPTERVSLSLSCSVGRVGENPGNEVARQLVSKLQHVTVPFLGQELTPLSSDKDLGIILDSNLPLSEHISTLAFSLLSNLCEISRVRHLFTKDVLNIILNSLIFSNLFYCSTVWSGKFKQNIKKLPLMQNFVARILSDTRKYDHISPMHELSWVTVKELLPLRDTTMIYKCLNSLTPSYLSSRLTEH